MTTAGLQAKVALRGAWFDAHPTVPIPEAREEVERLFADIEAEAALLAGHRIDRKGLREHRAVTGGRAMSIGYLQITFVDTEANEFRTVGGAGFLTMAETRRRFRDVPALDDSDLILDLLDRNGDILDDKPISRAVAEALLGEPLRAALGSQEVSDATPR